MEARKGEHNSMFETSHVLGSLLASSPILGQAWHHCALADAGRQVFVSGLYGDTAYVAFSGTHGALPLVGTGAGPAEAFTMVGLGRDVLFSVSPMVVSEGEDEEPIKVQALALNLFMNLRNSPDFQILLQEIRDKPVIFTGHSLGGSIASLAALYFLCNSFSNNSISASAPPLLCITFGAPLLGNESFSRAVLRERFAGNFCHVVSQHDINPRLFFCPLDSISPLILTSRFQLNEEDKAKLHKFVSVHVGAAAMEERNEQSIGMKQSISPYRPFGNYVLCSNEGAVCIDNPIAVVQMLYVTFVAGIEVVDLSYGELVNKIPQLLLLKKRIGTDEAESKSNYDEGISLALEASGIGVQGIGAAASHECPKISKLMGQSPNLNCASLAIKLGKITPCRAQIEWYKALCDDDMGYYDSFKFRLSPKKDSKANMNRMKLGQFWDKVIDMLQNNNLPYDFHKRAKWVNAAQFYKLLVEPLDIAEYYRTHMHRTKGHYLTHGRERRYEVFDKWWRGKDLTGSGYVKRSKFAGLTQDSCFWARVELAMEWLESVKFENDGAKLTQLCKDLSDFELYAKDLVERKEVSIDVLAPRSSYSLWVERWKSFKLGHGIDHA